MTNETPLNRQPWFIWSDNTFVVLSKADAIKVRTIRANAQVALNLNGDAYGGNIIVISGTVVIDDGGLTPAERAVYEAKYEEGIKSLVVGIPLVGGLSPGGTLARRTP
jgi:PPOX class probable F420-dependent enzyme